MTIEQKPMANPPADRHELTHHVEQFLYQEAELIDDGRLEEWLKLFTEDARYWVPANRDDIDPRRELSFIYDDKKRMEDRVWRLQSGLAHATDPPSRTRHLINNIRVGEWKDGELTVWSNFALFQLRRGEQNIFGGRCEHRLRWVDRAWKIAFKKVVLLNNDESIHTLQFIL